VIRDGALTFFVMLIMAVLVEDAALLVLYRNTWIVPWKVSSSEQMPNWYRRQLTFVIPTMYQLFIAESLPAEKGKNCESVL
jgi:hypothetical protein